MSCNKCGSPCTGRHCSQCQLIEHMDRRRDRKIDWHDCPRCDGITSAEGVICATCRAEDGHGEVTN